MRTETVLLFGAGGHGKVVMDALRALDHPPVAVIVVDEDVNLQGRDFFGTPIRAPHDASRGWSGPFHVAVGSGANRQRITAALLAQGARALTVVHPAAVVSPFATAGGGCFVAAGAIVGPAATLGHGVIVNHGAVIDHDCGIGDFAHVGPNATIGGAARIGAHALIGAGATVLAGGVVGERAIVGAGAVVVSPVGSMETHVGVPAAAIPRRKSD
jgi:sugar O-acyltransferase (sialic acid O-acetyltransferase NeuD family)